MRWPRNFDKKNHVGAPPSLSHKHSFLFSQHIIGIILFLFRVRETVSPPFSFTLSSSSPPSSTSCPSSGSPPAAASPGGQSSGRRKETSSCPRAENSRKK